MDNSNNPKADNIRYYKDTKGYADSDIWFKAATIAVPICGGVILLVLILLAVKILKAETSDTSVHKLGLVSLYLILISYFFFNY